MFNRLLLTTCLLAVPAVVPAQDVVFSDFGAGVGIAPQVATYQFISALPGPDTKQVQGAPFSAEGVTEYRQVLADGTTITRNNSSRIMRDSQGRTRNEQSLSLIGPPAGGGEPPNIVSISDPVGHQKIILHENDKTATVIKLSDTAAMKEGAEKVMAETRTIRMRTGAAGQGVSKENPIIQHKVEIASDGQPPMPPGVAFTATAGVAVGGAAWFTNAGPGDSKDEDLGTQVVSGVNAQGKRTTTTIPAGAIGNDRPISIVTERWYSPELQMMIMTQTKDPQSGETTYRLTNIQRSEPSKSLFEVPPDYTIREEPGAFNVEFLKK